MYLTLENKEFSIGTPQILDKQSILILKKADIDCFGFSNKYPNYHFGIHRDNLKRYILILKELKEEFLLDKQMKFFPKIYIEKYIKKCTEKQQLTKIMQSENEYILTISHTENYKLVIYPVLESDNVYVVLVNKITK